MRHSAVLLQTSGDLQLALFARKDDFLALLQRLWIRILHRSVQHDFISLFQTCRSLFFAGITVLTVKLIADRASHSTYIVSLSKAHCS